MPARCSVCQHPDRDAIDAALASGEAVRAVSRRTGIPKTTLLRHRQHGHSLQEPPMPMSAPPAHPPPEAPGLAALQEQLDALQAENRALRIEVGEQRARCAAIEARVQALAGQGGRQGDIVPTLQELFDLLAHNDDAWQTMQSMLSTSSLATRGTLHHFVATHVGRQPPAKYGWGSRP